VSAPEQTAQFPGADARDNDAQGNDSGDDTVLVPTDRDETTPVPVAAATPPQPVAEAEEQKPAEPVAAAVPAEEPKQAEPKEEPVAKAEERPVAAAPVEAGEKPTAATPAESDEEPTAVAPAVTEEKVAPAVTEEQKAEQPQKPTAKADDEPTGVAPSGKPAADDEATVVAPVEGPVGEKKGVDGPQGASMVQGSGGREQMGQQYRERMDNPEDTGEIYISAFENPTQVSIRPAGA
jgi:hypothetical protein